MSDEPIGLMDLQKVAAVLAVSPRHALNLVQRGILPPAVKLGRCSRWRVTDIQDALGKLGGGGRGPGRPRGK